MMSGKRLISHIRVVVLLVSVLCSIGAGMVRAQQCEVKVLLPTQGASVDWAVLVEGTAKLAPGSSLWVFEGPRGQNDWWPQGGGAAQLQDGGRWEVLARLGGSPKEDEGKGFVIVPVVVDRTTDDTLRKYIQEGRDTGKYPSLTGLPGVVQGCPLVKVNVKRR